MDEDIDLLEQNLRNELGLNWTNLCIVYNKIKRKQKKTIGEQYKSREEEE